MNKESYAKIYILKKLTVLIYSVKDLHVCVSRNIFLNDTDSSSSKFDFLQTTFAQLSFYYFFSNPISAFSFYTSCTTGLTFPFIRDALTFISTFPL